MLEFVRSKGCEAVTHYVAGGFSSIQVNAQYNLRPLTWSHKIGFVRSVTNVNYDITLIPFIAFPAMMHLIRVQVRVAKAKCITMIMLLLLLLLLLPRYIIQHDMN